MFIFKQKAHMVKINREDLALRYTRVKLKFSTSPNGHILPDVILLKTPNPLHIF